MLKASIAVAITTITLKTLAWYITDSVGLLSDAMESFVNLTSAIFALLMVTIAQRPADQEHPYGHNKAEYFSSGFDQQTIRFDHVITRRSGQRRFVDLHMHMPANWTLGQAAQVRGNVEQALMQAVPGLRATIQLLPSDVEAHLDDVADTPAAPVN